MEITEECRHRNNPESEYCSHIRLWYLSGWMVAFRKNTEPDLFSLEKLTSRFHNAAEYSHQLNPEEGFLLLFSLKLNTGAPGELFDFSATDILLLSAIVLF